MTKTSIFSNMLWKMYMLVTIHFLTLLQTNLAANESACELYKTRFMIALTNSKGRLICGGSLINSNWVLTAGSCHQPFKLYASDVFKSAEYGDEQEVVSWWTPVTRVVKIYLHPEFTDYIAQDEVDQVDDDLKRSEVHKFLEFSSQNDIALMKLQNGMDNTSINFVKLPFSMFLSSDSTEFCPTAATVGWNRPDGKDSEGTPTHLQCSELKTITHADCEHTIASNMELQISKTVMCTPEIEKTNFCLADAGGPLMCGDVQYGVLVEAIQCGNVFPTTYTRVDHYLSFIRQQLNPSLRSTNEGLFHSKLLIIVFILIKKIFS